MFGIFSNKIFRLLSSKVNRSNKIIFILVYILVSVSTIFVYSATRSLRFVYQNIIWIILGTVVMILISMIDYRELKRYMKEIYIVSAILLLAVRFFGRKTLGAQRWLRLGPFQLQPSEFVKIAIIIIIAYILSKRFEKGINNFFDIILGILPVTPLLFLILTQPDLGTTLIITMSYLMMIFLYRADMKPIWIIMIIVLIASYPTYKYILSDYQRTRIETFLNPENDLRGSGWHVSQSKISVGAGGLYGKGFLQGSQSRLEFLPEAQTDFIFSVIAEETGFIGSSLILLIYFLLILEILKISNLIQDKFGKLILYGVSGVIIMHVIVNVGMTVGLVPVTGKPLLFLSYGGSSFLSSFIMIGLVESIKITLED